MRYHIVSLLVFFSSYGFAQQIFVPLDQDFVLYDLEKTMIVKHFDYNSHPFGVRPQLSSDGKYLYYTKKLFNNTFIYQRNLQTNQEIAYSMQSEFTTFQLIADSRIMLDNQEIFTLPNVTNKQLTQPYMFPMRIDNDKKELYFDDEIFFLPSNLTAKAMQAYFLVKEDCILLNFFYFNEKEPWNSYYQWYLFDFNSNQLVILPSLRGNLRLSNGGVLIGERVEISYINKQ